jgi:hypothetical protein
VDALLGGLVPVGVVTFTETAPDPAGATAVTEVADLTLNDEADVPPNVTDVAPERPLPEIVTNVPPASGPADGDRPVTTGDVLGG